MSWKEKLDLLLLKLKVSIEPCFIGDKGIQEIKDFIEALIKETEQRVAREIFDDIRHSLSCYSRVIFTEYGTTNENISYQAINEFDLENIREKYIKYYDKEYINPIKLNVKQVGVGVYVSEKVDLLKKLWIHPENKGVE
jgi:hypothetical protein